MQAEGREAKPLALHQKQVCFRDPYEMLRIKPRTAKCEAKVLITVLFLWPQETLGLKKLFILYSNGELMVIPKASLRNS